jgi:O-antigen ligase
MLVAIGFLVASSPVIYRDHPDWMVWSLGAVSLLALIAVRWRFHITAALAVFVIWASASVIWTYDIQNTWIDVATLALSVVLGSALAAFGAATAARGLFLGSCVAVVASLAAGLLLPRLARSADFDGALVGIYAHRNFLASVAVLGLAITVAYLLNSKTTRARLGYLLALALFALTSVQTQSGTAMIISAMVLVGGSLLWILRASGPMGRFALVPILIASIALTIPLLLRALPDLAHLVGRDLTLTGRVDIWGIVMTVSAERPLTGFGWGGVWRGDLGDSIRATFGWDTANSAHNAFLDALIQVGWIGAALLSCAVVVAMIRSIRLAMVSAHYAWMALVLVALLVNSVSESQATRVIGTFLIALVSAVAWAENKALRIRHREPLANKVPQAL